MLIGSQGIRCNGWLPPHVRWLRNPFSEKHSAWAQKSNPYCMIARLFSLQRPTFVRLPPRRHHGRSALGIEHPRSAVVARNLALVRGAGRWSNSIASDCRHQDATTGEPGVNRWEGDMRCSIGSRRWRSTTDKPVGDGGGLANNRARRSSHLMPGGSPLSGMLARASGDTAIINDSEGTREKRDSEKKKVGKSARRG